MCAPYCTLNPTTRPFGPGGEAAVERIQMGGFFCCRVGCCSRPSTSNAPAAGTPRCSAADLPAVRRRRSAHGVVAVHRRWVPRAGTVRIRPGAAIPAMTCGCRFPTPISSTSVPRPRVSHDRGPSRRRCRGDAGDCDRGSRGVRHRPGGSARKAIRSAAGSIRRRARRPKNRSTR